jgi:hypothetical protein
MAIVPSSYVPCGLLKVTWEEKGRPVVNLFYVRPT